ncbi:MAG: iron-only hydrogenase system regulator [Firmicutes bacterium]|nr:iron-only hydrogenase system regulator [Bacillota bacterium]
MDTRVALIAIIVEQGASVQGINTILHEHADRIIGRMGVPYKAKNVNIISIAIDAPQDEINDIAGKIGRLAGVSAKTVYAAV